MSNWIKVLDIYVNDSLHTLKEEPFTDNVKVPLEEALQKALTKLNPDCSYDYMCGVRDLACCYIESKLLNSNFQGQWIDGDDYKGHFILSRVAPSSHSAIEDQATQAQASVS